MAKTKTLQELIETIETFDELKQLAKTELPGYVLKCVSSEDYMAFEDIFELTLKEIKKTLHNKKLIDIQWGTIEDYECEDCYDHVIAIKCE